MPKSQATTGVCSAHAVDDQPLAEVKFTAMLGASAERDMRHLALYA